MADLTDRSGGYFVGTKPSERYPIWTRANVGEVFPDPVRMSTFDFAFQNDDGIRISEWGFRDAYVEMGAFDYDEFDPDNCVFLGVFGGYTYLNAAVGRVFGARAPGIDVDTVDRTFFGEQPGIPPYEPHPDDASPDAEQRIGETFLMLFAAPALPEVHEDEQNIAELRAQRPDFTQMGDHEIIDWISDFLESGYGDGAGFRLLFARHLKVSFLAAVPLGVLEQVCTALGRPEDTLKLVAGFGDVASAAPSDAMWQLGRQVAASSALGALFDEGPAGLAERLATAGAAEPSGDAAAFNEAFASFVYEFGSRGPNEWEMSCPTWETDPDIALAAIDRMRLAPADAEPARRRAELAAQREALAAEISALLEADADTQMQFNLALGAAAVYLPGRERTKTNCVRFVNECRIASRVVGERLVERGQFSGQTEFGMLRLSEIHEMLDDPTGWAEVIAERQAQWDDAASRQEPFVIVGDPPPMSEWPRRGASELPQLSAGETFAGLPGCPGIARGRARVVLDSSDPTALSPGDVLVAPLTDPSWTPLFVSASAVVVDVGAALSHSVIVSRELGLPCVISATGATGRIPDGALIEVNGDTGMITVLEL
ncbi:PEP-utilizing enzyme [Candidatus Poriferisodalis multihospitum]|uniref:PEP-utilizing enzyme n=1 Tax=Candidatus Poriferisodalis multihospitum TaxID=2983191 RepID=UPI002B25AD73|nr:PEP-utilizing enzyme [Candidatus Poriferisodalis multihospitum]